MPGSAPGILRFIGFFLTLCGSFAVSEVVALGEHANEIEMVARPGGKILGVALTVGDVHIGNAHGKRSPTACRR